VEPPPKATLRELAGLFLRLGATAFGGPAAHIAMMEDEVVRRRRWLSRERFLDLLGATNLIPGPNSTEMAIHIGHTQAGWLGLIVAGTCFIVPAMIIVLAIAWAYVRYGTLPIGLGILYGVKPVIIGIVAQALARLGRTAIQKLPIAVIGVLAVVGNALGGDELVVLAAAGLAAVLARLPSRGAAAALALPAASAAGAAPFAMGTMFLFFLKVGAVLFGSGYVLIAFLRADLVTRWHWLSESQLLDAIAVGQVTPGPVFTTATFIGYVLGGTKGGLLATLGIFLPAFVFVAASGPIIPRLRRSAWAGAFLDGVNVGSLALMAVVTAQLAGEAIVDVPTAVLAAASLGVLLRWQVNSSWLVLVGAAVGVARTLLSF